MVGKKKLEDTQQVGLRLPLDIITRADAYAAQLSAEHPGMSYTRTDAIRIILATHLPPLPALPTAKPTDTSKSPPVNASPTKRTAKRKA